MSIFAKIGELISGGLLKDAGAIVDNLTTSKEEKLEAQRKLLELEQNYKSKIFELEVQDRDSARKREMTLLAQGKRDWFMWFVGIVGLASFCFSIYVVSYLTIPEANRELFINLLGIIEGAVISIFGYYYGSSRGSDQKTDIIKNGK